MNKRTRPELLVMVVLLGLAVWAMNTGHRRAEAMAALLLILVGLYALVLGAIRLAHRERGPYKVLLGFCAVFLGVAAFLVWVHARETDGAPLSWGTWLELAALGFPVLLYVFVFAAARRVIRERQRDAG